VGFHRQALQPQFADRTAIDRCEVRINQMRLRKARQQAADCDGDGSAAELWLAMNVDENASRSKTLVFSMA
jgi:hypothetical protein